MTGFSLSYRAKWEHPVFRNKQEAAVWAWMCDIAQWKPTRLPTKFGPVQLERGELIFAERTLADDFGMHRNVLRALIHRMVADGMIALFRDRMDIRNGTVCLIVNYEKYQAVDNVSGSPQDRIGTTDGTASGPHRDHIGTKNKEDNKGNKDLFGTSGEAPPKDKRGTRLPADWELPPAWRADAMTLGMPPPMIEREADRFRDYWHGAAGAKGVKLDWAATWRNWARSALDRMGPKNAGQPTRHNPATADADERRRRLLAAHADELADR